MSKEIEMKDRYFAKEPTSSDIDSYKRYLNGVGEMFAFVMQQGFSHVVVKGFNDLNECLKFQKNASMTGLKSMVYHVPSKTLVSYLVGVVGFDFDGLIIMRDHA